MPEKIRNTEFPQSLTGDGWFIPTDYVLMKRRFRNDVMRLYAAPLARGSKVLDLNAGTDGLGAEFRAAGHDYSALEQNPLLRQVLREQGVPVAEWRPPRIPRESSSIDLVLSFAFLEHLPTWISAMEMLLEIKRVLAPAGRFLVVAPNGPGMGSTFWDDYKHGWYVSRKRLVEMAGDAGLEVLSSRYSVGWATLAGGSAGAILRVGARSTNTFLNLPVVRRLVESVGLEQLSAKVRKTIFELVAIELGKL